MAHSTDIAATAIVLVVGLITLAMTILAVLAQRRSQNPRLWFVAGAFGLFTLKSLLIAWALQTGSIAHQHLEVVSSGFDLAIVALLVVPLLR